MDELNATKLIFSKPGTVGKKEGGLRSMPIEHGVMRPKPEGGGKITPNS